MRTTGFLAALGLTLASVLGGCGGSDSNTKPTPSPVSATTTGAAPVQPVSLTFGVFGGRQRVAAYQGLVDSYRSVEPEAHITIRSWPDEHAMLTDIAHGGEAPDVFLTSGGDLQTLIDGKLIRPVDTYLDARNVDLGDGYSRDALESFSVDRHLQCMPYTVSPDVVYYNTDLVNFQAMQARGLPVPDPESGTWNLEQFQAALRFASTPRAGIKGVYVTPTVRGIAPWLVGAGGKLFDDERAPTRLAFSDPDSVSALQSLLPTLTHRRFRLTDAQLGQSTPLRWFERGKLAMMVGDRSLVPQLRADPDLHWDVMSMPSPQGGATTGDYTGLCLSGSTKKDDAAADFLTYLITKDAVAQITRTGYVVPVNQEVAYTNAFRQPDRRPQHADVFLAAIKGLQALPARDRLDELDAALGSELQALLGPRGAARAEALGPRIDDISAVVLAPPGQSPSASPTD